MKNINLLVSISLFLVLLFGCGKDKSVFVPIKVTEITLNYTNLTKKIGDTEKLVATITPNNATDKSIKWESSNSDIVSIDNQGVLTAVKEGTATITAISGEKIAECVVNIIPKGMTITDGTLSKMKNENIPSDGHVTIPSSIIKVGEKAFLGCEKLTSLTIPNSVENIGRRAFEDCKNLTSITFGTSVKTIEVYAFEGCEKLTSITLLSETPPILKGYIRGDLNSMEIKVPMKAVSAYKNAEVWKLYKEYISGI